MEKLFLIGAANSEIDALLKQFKEKVKEVLNFE